MMCIWKPAFYVLKNLSIILICWQQTSMILEPKSLTLWLDCNRYPAFKLDWLNEFNDVWVSSAYVLLSCLWLVEFLFRKSFKIPKILARNQITCRQRTSSVPHSKRTKKLQPYFTDTKFLIYDPEFLQRRHFHRDLPGDHGHCHFPEMYS
jgi:hypothetical protein